MLRIHSTTTPREDAAHALNQALAGAAGGDVLLHLSGGSALALVPLIDVTLLGERTTVTVLDERYTFDSAASNFAQLAALPFFAAARERGAEFIDPRPREGETLEACAQRFDLALKHWHILHRDGVGICTLGIGPDGHTSGILPFPKREHEFKKHFGGQSLCIRGYRVSPDKNPHTERMTTTLTYLTRHIAHGIALVEGAQKRDALAALLAPEGALEQTPARILRGMSAVDLYTDLAALGGECNGLADA